MLIFDIILPTIGRDSLQSAFDSVQNQTYNHWHLYTIIDMPWLGIEGRILELPATRHTVICSEGSHNDSGTYARNFGIANGDAEWIAYIDDDDEWLPNHLEVHARIIEENPSVSMVRTAGQSFKMKHKSPRSSKLVRKMGPVNSTDVLTVGMSHTRELFNKTPGWKPGTAHDRDLWNAMLAAGGKAIESDAVTFLFAR